MPSVDDVLDQITVLCAAVRLQEAQEVLSSLIGELGPDELRVWEADLLTAIGLFLPKRRRQLAELLSTALAEVGDNREVGEGESAVSREMRTTLDRFQEDLTELSEYHIFQWGSWYRDAFTKFEDQFLEATHRGQSSTPVPSLVVREMLDAHAYEIFTKGYDHTRRRGDQSLSLGKARAGLQRFLDIPVEYYSAGLAREPTAQEAGVLRKLTSSILAGILRGFSRCEFGQLDGAAIMAPRPEPWVHALAFLTAPDMDSVLDRLEPVSGPLRFSECRAFSAGVDRFAAAARRFVPLPSLSEFRNAHQTLEITLGPSGASGTGSPISSIVALSDHSLSPSLLIQAQRDGVSAVVGRADDETWAFIAVEPQYDLLVIDPTRLQDPVESLARLLERAAFRGVSGVASQPIRHNYAREFPIGNPFLARYYRVERPSVRDLLRTVERRNGVRLWCSVRRSGKTTAGLDLASISPDVDVITQTCDDTGQILEEQVLYRRVISALEDGRHLDSNFLGDALADCSAPNAESEKKVLILDEYETLFGTLAAEGMADARLRYSVVQPLLNQFVSFSRDNLVVFLGQQPTAHHIFMDQNQLSPYVLQDQFPLFRHSSPYDEFPELLSRILTARVIFDDGFARRVFAETAGHPYMTVNLMVDLVDWLIAGERRTDRLSLTKSDFDEFAIAQLTKSKLVESASYQFFRDAVIGEALGAMGKRQSPWLHAVYGCMREICLESPVSLSITRSDFSALFNHLGYAQLGITPEYLLTTAASSNFFEYDSLRVSPKIRLLGRLATVAPIKMGNI